MARVIEVVDPADPRLADYRDLRDVQLRKHLEAEQVRAPAIIVVGDVVAVAHPERFAAVGG